MDLPFTPVEVFYSFTEADASLLEQLERHLSVLRHEGFLSTWHRRQIVAGTDWQTELDRHLNTASLILLLISPDFLASKYQYGVELQRVMQRHDSNEACVIPIVLRACDWEGAPFGRLQVVPRNGKAITSWHNRDEAFVEIAREIRVALKSVQHLTVSASSTLHSGVWNVPYLRNPHFTGRDELLERLNQQLSPSAQNNLTTTCRAALTQPQAIKGLGGIGKTQIAVEYAYRSRERDQYTHIFWMNAANEAVLLTSFVALAELLPAFPIKDETDQRKLVEVVKRWLEQCQQQWLLIFDNADDIALVRDYLPQRGNGSILLTTRADAVGALATSVEVEIMGFVEGTHLLLRRTQRFEQASDEEVNQAGNIVVALDHFPLALDQAGAYIEETQCSFVDYLGLYQNYRQELLARRGTLATDYPNSVATTWDLSFQKVQQINPAAAELLHLCAFLAPDRIPEELIRDGAVYWPPLLQQAAADLFTFQQTIAELLKFSLVKRLAENHTLSIHHLVQAVQRNRIEPETQRQWAENVVRAVNQVFPDDAHDPTMWPQCLRYLDQAQACNTLIGQYMLQLIEAASLLNRTGWYLYEHAFYTIAEPLYQHALAIREQELGPTHLLTAASLNNLATLYQAQGKYTEAEPLLKRALAINEQELGPTHPDTAQSLNNLAALYLHQGKYAEAEPLFEHALAIREQELGLMHPDTANSLNNLAGLYDAQGRYTEAEPLYRRALIINAQELGLTHPDTANSFNNLALLYKTQGRYAEAEPLLKSALVVYEQELGPTHPSTALKLNNLARLYQDQGKYTEAEPLLKRALAVYEQRLGPTHPDTAQSLNNLAVLYQAQGKYTEVEPLLKRALEIDTKAYGAEHPKMAIDLNNLAELYRTQGKYAEAEPLLKHALVVYEQQLGPTHAYTASSLNNLAALYRAQGKYTEAESLYQRALAINEQELGPTHPDTAQSLNNLAVLYQDQGKYEQAEPHLERALAIREQELGPTHAYTASSLNNLAALYRAQGKYTEAEPLCQRALAIREQELGPTHPDTAQSLNSLAALYYHQGKYTEAEPLCQRSLAIREQELGPTHPDTASSLNNLAKLYHDQGKYEQAEPLYLRTLLISEQELGPTHPDTAGSLNNLAGLYDAQGKYTEAEPLYQRSLAIREQELGPTHPDTANSLNNLAMLYYYQGKYEQAEPLYQRALCILEQSLGPGHPTTQTVRKNCASLLRTMRRGAKQKGWKRMFALFSHKE